MFKKDKKYFSIYLFVASSLFVFVIFVVIMFIGLSNFKYKEINRIGRVINRNVNGNDKIFLNLDYEHKDPYTTKIPNLRDILAGPIITDLDPSLGNINSSINLVLFSDFECSYCAKQERVLKEILKEYNIRLIWKDYPISDTESMSFKSAIAGRCAQLENAFWDYHDLLFEANSDISRDKLISIAEELHLDIDEFSDCLDNNFTAELVHDNILEAEALGVNGIPFLYVNDREVLGEIDKRELEQLIEAEMKKVK